MYLIFTYFLYIKIEKSAARDSNLVVIFPQTLKAPDISLCSEFLYTYNETHRYNS